MEADEVADEQLVAGGGDRDELGRALNQGEQDCLADACRIHREALCRGRAPTHAGHAANHLNSCAGGFADQG
ncbi:hypothetical protein GCM10007890_32130 [Methylobacterium tardum]|uniref:Uncharacterized protein n=1 Tax=Methylobacterium tardum TaxID=374432 RepID=A0AA37WRH4_9HYPH|nr:hypothetical protein GCM10007890_32130 [Methylobacterium tardum]